MSSEKSERRLEEEYRTNECRIDECRICKNSSHSLINPCKCDGTIKYVHKSCLKTWIAVSRSEFCEICKERYILKTKFRNFLDMYSKYYKSFFLIFSVSYIIIYPLVYMQLSYLTLSYYIFIVWFAKFGLCLLKININKFINTIILSTLNILFTYHHSYAESNALILLYIYTILSVSHSIMYMIIKVSKIL